MRLRASSSLAVLCSCALVGTAYAANPPANICIELTNWIEQVQAKAGAAPPPGAAVQPQRNASRQSERGRSEEGGGGTAVEQPRGAPATPSGQDTAQKHSGVSGQVPDGGPGAAGPQGQAQESSKSGAINPQADARKLEAPAPARPAVDKAPPPTPQDIDKARRSAGGNDLEGCSAVVREMRIAGVALPSTLIALAALKPEVRQMAPQGPAPGVPPIPPSGTQPGEPPAAPPPEAPR